HGADGEGIVIALDLSGIAASTGSACSSGRIEPSHVLIAMGLPEAEARATVRFSLSRFTTAGGIGTTAAVLRDVLSRVRRAGGVSRESGVGSGSPHDSRLTTHEHVVK